MGKVVDFPGEIADTSELVAVMTTIRSNPTRAIRPILFTTSFQLHEIYVIVSDSFGYAFKAVVLTSYDEETRRQGNYPCQVFPRDAQDIWFTFDAYILHEH